MMQALVDGAVDTQMAAFLVLLRAKVSNSLYSAGLYPSSLKCCTPPLTRDIKQEYSC